MTVLAASFSLAQIPGYIYLILAVIVSVVLLLVTQNRPSPKKEESGESEPAELIPAPAPAAPAPGTAGQLKIYDVPPKTAAMLMAIVAEKTGKPLNELRFISIKEVK